MDADWANVVALAEAVKNDEDWGEGIRLQAAILLELRLLNGKIAEVETAIANVKLNSSHPLIKLLFR